MADSPKPEQKAAVSTSSAGDGRGNCQQCAKPLKRKTRYYRNQFYFCGKGCYQAWEAKRKSAAASALPVQTEAQVPAAPPAAKEVAE